MASKGGNPVKQFIVTVGLALLGLMIFRMMITDSHGMYKAVCGVISQTRECYECRN